MRHLQVSMRNPDLRVAVLGWVVALAIGPLALVCAGPGPIAAVGATDAGQSAVEPSQHQEQDESASLELLAQWGGVYTDLDVEAGRAFLVFGGRRVEVFDSESGALLGRSPELPEGVGIDEIAVEGDHVYLSAGRDGLLVLDVDDPTAIEIVAREPIPIWQTSIPGTVTDIELGDEILALEVDRGDIQVFDISSPESPRALSLIDAEPGSKDYLVHDRHLYLPSARGLNIYDMRDPTAPRLVRQLDIGTRASHLAASGDRLAFFAGSILGLRLLDISDPSDPRELAALAPADIGYIHPLGLFLDATQLGILHFGGVLRVDTTAPSGPIPLPGLEIVWQGNAATWSMHGEIAGGRLHLLSSPYGYSVISLSEAEMRVERHGYGQHDIRRVAIVGDRAYLADGERGFDVLDVSDPRAPRLLTPREGLLRQQGSSRVEDLAIVDGIVYTSSSGHLIAYELTEDDGSMVATELARIELDFTPRRLSTQGFWVVAEDSRNLAVFDASTPAAPVLRWQTFIERGPLLASAVRQGRLVSITMDQVTLRTIETDGRLLRREEISHTQPEGNRGAAIGDDIILIEERTGEGPGGDTRIRLYRTEDLSLVAMRDGLGLVWEALLHGRWLVHQQPEGEDDRLMLRDLSSPQDFTQAPESLPLRSLDGPLTLQSSGNHLFASSTRAGLRIIDLPPPSSLPEPTPNPTPSPASLYLPLLALDSPLSATDQASP